MSQVEVIYVPDDGRVVQYSVPCLPLMTVGMAIESSGIARQFPETAAYAVGVFSHQVTRDTPVRAGDRVEIYRPLQSDPKEKRKQRASGVMSKP